MIALYAEGSNELASIIIHSLSSCPKRIDLVKEEKEGNTMLLIDFAFGYLFTRTKKVASSRHIDMGTPVFPVAHPRCGAFSTKVLNDVKGVEGNECKHQMQIMLPGKFDWNESVGCEEGNSIAVVPCPGDDEAKYMNTFIFIELIRYGNATAIKRVGGTNDFCQYNEQEISDSDDDL